MKKGVSLFIISFLLIGILAGFPFVLALYHSNSNSNSGSNSENSGSTNSGVDDPEESNDEEDDDNSGSNSGSEDGEGISGKDKEKVKEEFKREFITDDGKRVEIERKIEVEDGRIKIEIRRTITDENGNKVEVKIKIEERADGKKVVMIEGKEEFDVETELKIETDFENNESDLEVTTSDGVRHKVIVLPDRASEVAIEKLKSKNFTVELKEVTERNIPRVVYNIEANKHGRFLGVFKLKVRVEGQIDPETGEIIGVSKPWWAFLVIGEDSDQTETESEENNAVSNEQPVLGEEGEGVEEMIVEEENEEVNSTA